MNYLLQNAVVVQAQYYNYRHSHYNIQKIKGKQTNKKNHQAQAILKSNWANSIRFQGMGIILCGSGFHPLGPWLHPESHSSSSMKGSCVCSYTVLSTCFLPVEFWESDSFLLVCPFFLSFSPNWQCFCWYDILKNHVNFLCMSLGFTPREWTRDSATHLSWIILSLFLASTELSKGIHESHVSSLQRTLSFTEYSKLWILLRFPSKVVQPHPSFFPPEYAFLTVLCSVTRSCPAVCNPMDCSPPGSSARGGFPGKDTGGGCHARLQGIFPTQGLNPGLPQCRWILYHLSHSHLYPGLSDSEFPDFSIFCDLDRLRTSQIIKSQFLFT